MAKITYLLGAGASANSLPVLKELRNRLVLFRDHINDFLNMTVKIEFFNDHQKPARDLIFDIEEFLSKMSNHSTIDTFARKLFARECSHFDLKRLKVVLSAYFVFEQIPLNKRLRSVSPEPPDKQQPDKRYDTLIASILSYDIDDLSLSKDVKVLSWNYDVQFELAYMLFTGMTSLESTHESLQIIPGEWIKKIDLDLNKFSLVHLNGVAGYRNFSDKSCKQSSIIDKYNLIEEQPESMMASIIDYYKELSIQEPGTDEFEDTSYFNYSWENRTATHPFMNSLSEKTRDHALSIAKETDILVVIGYSFPIFNRWYDKDLIQEMTSLTKVYIQDCNPEMIKETMENGFDAFQPPYHSENPEKDFITSNNLDQFIIPSELTL